MKCTVPFPVATAMVVPALKKAVEELAAAHALQFDWSITVVQTNDPGSKIAEYGAVLYPVRQGKIGEKVAYKEHRIVMGSLPSTTKVKTCSVDLSYARAAHDKVVGTIWDENPKLGIFSRDRKYANDFASICAALVDILTATAGISSASSQHENAAVAA